MPSTSLPPLTARPAQDSSSIVDYSHDNQVATNLHASQHSMSCDQLPKNDLALMPETTNASDNRLSVSQLKRMHVYKTSADLELLCKENGLSAAQFAQNGESVTTLAMFLGFWTSMTSVMYFPALKELAIINQPTIYELEGVESCPQLEKLCVTECGLKRIANVGKCTKLQHLNLSSNKIQRLDNLDALVNLEKFWVNENELERLDGLERLTKLTRLWACRNRIERIDTALNGCVNLIELNLADNRLASFKGLLSLLNLDQLTILTLHDPHFGDNPVCRLSNYQTYLMCQFPRLKFLDTMELSTRSKQIAEATMIKKKMYYNMRMKTIKRDVYTRLQHAEMIRKEAEDAMETSVSALVRHKKEIERVLYEKLDVPSNGPKSMLKRLQRKLECVDTCLRDCYAAVYRMHQDFDRLRTTCRCTSETNIARLLLELESGGNIRFEEGSPSDSWFGTCVELVRSRLYQPELHKFGIKDVQINRVTRIKNRYLRNRFQARMEEVLEAPAIKTKDNVTKKGVTISEQDGENMSERRSNTEQRQFSHNATLLETSMEYLFYAQSTRLEDQQMHGVTDSERMFIAENGFRKFPGLDFGSAIKLCNSIALLDTPRINAALAAKGQQLGINGRVPLSSSSGLTQDMMRALQLVVSGEWDLPGGFLLVAKVFPGYTKCISNADVELVKASALERSEDCPVIQSVQVTHSATTAFAGAETLTEKQKVYYVFDNALVLPEYFVEYQYVLENAVLGSPRASNTPVTLSSATSPRAVHCNNDDALNFGVISKQVDDFDRKYHVWSCQSPHQIRSSMSSSVDKVLQMEPQLPGSKVSSDAIISTVPGQLQAASLSRIKYLSLLGCQLESIPDLSMLNDHLNVLVLSYNKIQETKNLQVLSKLQELDLSYNHIVHLGYLAHFRSLKTLEVTHNLIQSFENVRNIGHMLGNYALKQLDLRKNAICDLKRYRLHVLQHLPRLVLLDQQNVLHEEIVAAQQLIIELSPSKVWSVYCQKSRCSFLTSASETAPFEATNHHSEYDNTAEVAKSPRIATAWSSVEELVLTHELIESIQGLEKAVNLRVVSFSDNVLKQIDGLQACTRLEELSLDENEISRIENLEHLLMLKKLHLGHNRLTVIQNLDLLANLVQLSLEDNEITSLRGLGSALKLMELYMGNNRIEHLKEIQYLKSLPKLTILDLTGNKIAQLPDYRIYSVYYLRRLKVLDGGSVTAQDQSSAKQKYNGKLTFELILDKCEGSDSIASRGAGGDHQLGRILDMQLSSCQIRDIGRIQGKVFSSVRKLNLENNQISEISGLEALPQLLVLNLSRNRIERLLPSCVASNGATLETCDDRRRGILACVNLEELHLAYNQIKDMTTLGLQFLDSLKVLHLQGNAITSFAGVESSIELIDIRLDKNRIRQLDPYSTLALRRLKMLSLEENGLRSLSNFNNMISLDTLELSNNRLVELEEVDKLVEMVSMVDLRMVNNPLTRKHLYRQHVLYKLTSLQVLDGKKVYTGERERISLLFSSERTLVAASGAALTVVEKAIGIHAVGVPDNEMLTGSPLRKAITSPTTTSTLAPPEPEVNRSIAPRSLLASTLNFHRGIATLSTITDASALNATFARSGELYGSSFRRRLSNVHYDQQMNVLRSPQVDGKMGKTLDVKLPVGIVSSPALGRGSAPTLRRGVSTAKETPSARDFSGYVLTLSSQKRDTNFQRLTPRHYSLISLDKNTSKTL